MELEVLPELDELLPRTAEEEEKLKTSLEEDGCRDAIIVWKDQNIIVDGMTRYRLCKELGIEDKIKVVEKDFQNLYDVKIWMVKNQTARRNLTPGQKAFLLAKVNGEKVKKERNNLSPKQSKKVTETEEKITQAADIKVMTYRNAEAVLDGGSEKLKNAVNEGIIPARPAKKLSKYPHEFQDKVLEELENSDEHPEVFIDIYLANMKKEDVQKIADREIDVVKADHLKKSKSDVDRLERTFSGFSGERKIGNEQDESVRKLFRQISILENLKTSEIECDGINIMKFIHPENGKTIRDVLRALTDNAEEQS